MPLAQAPSLPTVSLLSPIEAKGEPVNPDLLKTQKVPRPAGSAPPFPHHETSMPIDMVAIILETTKKEASQKSKLRRETMRFLHTLHKYLDCRAKMDAKYLEVGELRAIAKYPMIPNLISAEGRNASLECKAEYQQQSIEGKPVQSLDELFDAAERATAPYHDTINRIIGVLSMLLGEEDNVASLDPARLKSRERAKEKAEDDYGKQKPSPGFAWLYDIVRGSIEFESATQLTAFLNLLRCDSSIHIVKSKNRFREPRLTGYRDINVQFLLDTMQGFKLICELQIHHTAIRKLDKELKSHDYYEYFRSFFAGATSSLQERLEVLKLISDGGAIDDSFLHQLLETSKDVERLERLGAMFRDQFCEYHWALLVYGKLVEIHVQDNGADHPKVAHAFSDMALVLKEQGKLDEAMELYSASLDIYKMAKGDENELVAETYVNMALVMKDQGKLEEAMDLLRKSLKINDKGVVGEVPSSVATTYSHMATILRMQGKLDEAMQLYEISLKVERGSFGGGHWSVAETLQNMAIVLSIKGKFEESMTIFQDSLEITKKQLGENHSSVAVAYRNMALVCEKQVKLDRSLALYEKSLEIYKSNVGEKHLLVADIFNDMAYSLKEQGSPQRAKDFLRKSLKIKKRLSVERTLEAGIRSKLVNRRSSLWDGKRVQ